MSDYLMDQILVVDLESTCWEKESDKPRNEVSDIIEIGVSHLDVETLLVNKSWNILVKPTRSSVSEFCTKLTGHTQEALNKDGVALPVAMGLLLGVKSKNRLWASYGDYDRKKIERDCRDLKIDYPFGPRHLNIKSLFAYSYGLTREVGMDKALEILGEKLEGHHHSGLDDTKNISKILKRLLFGARTETRMAAVNKT